MTVEVGKKRRIDLDILKIIGIILVLIGHSYSPWPIENLIYSFHMPLFFFISGYFYTYKGFLATSSNKLKTLLLPYFLISLLLITISIFFSLENHSTEDIFIALITGQNEKLFWNSPLWFLPTLFSLVLTYSILYCCFKRTKIVHALAFLLCILVISFPLNRNYAAMGIDTALIAIPFFSAGMISRNSAWLSELKLHTNIFLAFIVILLFIFIRFESGQPYFVMARLRIENFPIFYLTGLTCSIGLLLGARAFEQIGAFKLFNTATITRYSSYSFAVYLFHKPIIELLKSQLHWQNSFQAMITYSSASLFTAMALYLCLNKLSPITTQLLTGGRTPTK